MLLFVMDPAIAKLAAIYIVAIIGFWGGLIPAMTRDLLCKIVEVQTLKLAFRILLCVARGALLLTCTTFLIPSVIFDTNYETGDKWLLIGFPFDVFLMSIGFYCSFLFDEIAPDLVITKVKRPGKAAKRRQRAAKRQARIEKFRVKVVKHQDEPPKSLLVQKSTSEFFIKKIVKSGSLAAGTWLGGMAIGMQNTIGGVWVVLAAVSLYVLGSMASMSLKLMNSNKSVQSQVMYIVALVMFAPMGISLGGFLYGYVLKDCCWDLPVMFFVQALIVGGLFYVAVSEVLNGDRKRPIVGVVNVLLVMIGYMSMLLVMHVLM